MTAHRMSSGEGLEAAGSPIEVASALRHLPGMVFFDSSGHWPSHEKNVLSRIAVAPIRELHGRIDRRADMDRLREELRLGAAAGYSSGGLAGWVTYEGDFCFGVYPKSMVYDHRLGKWNQADEIYAALGEQSNQPIENDASVGGFRASLSKEDFILAVQQAQQWIASGDIYQVNVSRSFEAIVSNGSLFRLYEHLRSASPAPMSGWFSLGGVEVLCSSPESFLRLEGGRLWTHPIKGTRPRGEDEAADVAAVKELRESVKERAELVMITDLLRNDLGKVCAYGSVKVEDLLRVETLEQVHHMVSTVTGELMPGFGIVDVFEACFPGGSITGAPKKRAMEIIRELEPVPRGLYCGSVGWLGFDGSSVCNIAIRTIVRKGDRMSYHCGAGIVADSHPEMEFQETEHKAAGIRLALERWQE